LIVNVEDRFFQKQILYLFCADYYRKESKMTADKINTFDVLIEIQEERNKYEYDFEIKRMRFDRMLFSSMMYPADYGFRNSCLRWRSIDVLVLVNEPTFPGCVMEVKPIGVSYGRWRTGKVMKNLSDPWNSLNDLSDMKPHLLKEIEHFFRCIKILKTKQLM
jgi:inorganic pyrophosphatase